MPDKTSIDRQRTSPPPPVPAGSAPAAPGPVIARPATRDPTHTSINASLNAPGIVSTPEGAFRRRDIDATRRFVWAAFGLMAVVGGVLPLLEGDAHGRVALALAYGTALVGLGYTAWRLRRPDRYGARDAALLAATSFLAGSCGIYYFGFFSPAPLATTMGLFFFGLVRDARVAFGAYAATALVHGAMMSLIVAGVLDDHGLIRVADSLSVAQLVVIIALVEVVFLMTFVLARTTHASMVASTRELEASARVIAAREALLDEARRELEAALVVGGPGRFTEQRLGRFELGNLIGRGAVGDIYEAIDLAIGAPVAVKLLHRGALIDPVKLRRFLREARITQSLAVENVVRVVEVAGEDAPVPYLAMELLRGEDLATILRRARRLGRSALIDLLVQVGRGIDAAHAAGIVHRDLKPQNLYRASVDGRRVWKVLDFGMARLIDAASTLTAGQAVGTPAYMSPEQARAGRIDHRADLFGLGIVAYRCLTGRPAFTGGDILSVMYDVVDATPPRPSSLVAVPEDVDRVMAIALAKEPAGRFDSAAQLATAMTRAFDGALTAPLRARGDALIAAWPWGERRAGR